MQRPGQQAVVQLQSGGAGTLVLQGVDREGGEPGALRLHFTMADNPGLSPEIRQRYERLYTGVFYRRFVQGEWAAAQGLVYDFSTQPEMRHRRRRGPSAGGGYPWITGR